MNSNNSESRASIAIIYSLWIINNYQSDALNDTSSLQVAY